MKAIRSPGAQVDAERLKLALVALFMILGLAYLTAALHRIQVRDSGEYADAQNQYSFRRVRLPATRGRILDRNDVVLADNVPSYCVAFYIEELRQPKAWSNTVHHVDKLIDHVSGIIQKPREVDIDGIWAHIKRRRAIPLFAFKGLDAVEMARLAEWPGSLPGVDIYVQPERKYPLHTVASHIIGYVGKGNPQEAPDAATEPDDDAFPENPDAANQSGSAADFDFYLPDLAGRDGIEKAFDATLAGRGGGELIRVNAVGYKHEVLPGRDPVPGKDVALTLDSQLQIVAERALSGYRGAAVVVDCNNGEILAMANSPRYNLSDFVPNLAPDTWRRLLNDPEKPLYNRASSGKYPPGSVFKPVVALRALQEGVIDKNFTLTCTGEIEVGGRKIRCASRYGHGELQLEKALAVSCNPYIIAVGLKMGYEPLIHDEAEALGFGTAPRIGIPATAGLLPTDSWKRARFKEGWRGGDTANISMGQGYITASPLQVAMMTAAIANGGRVLAPKLVKDGNTAPDVIRTMPWRSADLATIKKGMYDAMHMPYGTGRRVNVPGLQMGGKTGTAEYIENREKKKHAWMIVFAPFDNPKYALAVVAEDSDAGGTTAAGIMQTILRYMFPSDGNAASEDSATPDVFVEDLYE